MFILHGLRETYDVNTCNFSFIICSKSPYIRLLLGLINMKENQNINNITRMKSHFYEKILSLHAYWILITSRE